MCLTGDPYKNRSVISRRSECYEYKIHIRISLLSISKSSVLHTRDVNKHKFVIGKSMYAKLLYEFLKIPISVIVL